MPLSSLFQRFRQAAQSGQAMSMDATPLSQSDVEAARVRARRRLIGMVVLVGAGVIGFPWLFETQPRPMSPDVQVVQAGSAVDGGLEVRAPGPSGHSAAGRVAVAGIVGGPKVEPAVTPAAEPIARADEDRQPAPARQASPAPSRPVVVAKAAATPAADKPASRPQAKEQPRPPAKEPAKSVPKPADKVADKPADKSPDKSPDKASTRYVVQFGAFADANTAQVARMKVERLGIKTYTQQVDTPAGKRIRVRMGPYADKAEADKAMATLRKAGLTGAVLTL